MESHRPGGLTPIGHTGSWNMRWRRRRQNKNVEDRYGMSPRAAVGDGACTLIVIPGRLGGCDMNEAITAATQISDGRLQMEAQGYQVPERYTHGASAQCVRWFHRGLRSSDLNQYRRIAELPNSDT